MVMIGFANDSNGSRVRAVLRGRPSLRDDGLPRGRATETARTGLLQTTRRTFDLFSCHL